MDGSHGVLLVAVKPDILCNIREVAGLVLLDRFRQWLVAHAVELDVLRAVLQCCRWGRVEQS